MNNFVARLISYSSYDIALQLIICNNRFAMVVPRLYKYMICDYLNDIRSIKASLMP